MSGYFFTLKGTLLRNPNCENPSLMSGLFIVIIYVLPGEHTVLSTQAQAVK